MERVTFPDPAVQAELATWHLVKLDADKEGKLAQQYGVSGLPTMVVLNSKGETQGSLVGGIGPADLVQELKRVRP